MPPAASPVRPRARVSGVAILGAFAGVSITAACSLDWGVRPNGPADGSVAEAGVDAPVPVDAADAADGAVVDAPVGLDGAGCVALAADVAAKRAKAKDCTIGTLCMSTLNDECDCPITVRVAGSTDDTDYANAVAALVAACGKPAACGACNPVGAPGTWTCLQNGAVRECYPF